jgi:hypothetical protein
MKGNKSLDRFVHSLKRAGDQVYEKTTIAFGNGRFASHGKGEQAVPLRRLQKKLEDNYEFYLIDENLTTKICHKCDECTKSFTIVRSSSSVSPVSLTNVFRPTRLSFGMLEQTI